MTTKIQVAVVELHLADGRTTRVTLQCKPSDRTAEIQAAAQLAVGRTQIVALDILERCDPNQLAAPDVDEFIALADVAVQAAILRHAHDSLHSGEGDREAVKRALAYLYDALNDWQNLQRNSHEQTTA